MFRVLLSPRLIGLHLLAIAAVTAAGLLGMWQYDAWDTRRETQATDLADAAPKPLDKVMSPDDPFPGGAVGQPVELSGQWLSGETFFVAHRQLAGRTGYWVITPVEVCSADCGKAPAMLVVRGWTARPSNAPPAPRGSVDVTGWLQPPEGSGRQDPDPRDDVLQEVRTADAIQRLDQDLYGAYVVAETPRPTGLEPVTPASLPEPSTFTAWRNLLYAIEWWVFGVFALFVWWRWCRDQIEESRPSQHAEAAEVASNT